MHLSMLDMLVCPECKVKLELKTVNENYSIKSGMLVCEKCNAQYLITNYIPRFVNTDKYVSSFSLEWAKHSRTQLDSVSGLKVAESTFFERTGFNKEELKDKTILDASCGIGRFMEVAQKYCGHVVGLDMSFSVEQAYENVGNYPNVDIVQADIMRPPFKDDSFDALFSIGVLHHTPNTKQAFESLVKLVVKSGQMAIWVYSNEGLKTKLYNTIAAFYRLFTTRIPKSALYKLCRLAIPLYYLHKIPIIGLLFRTLFPTSMEPIPEWRVLDNFDWYSPKYQFKHTYKEVEGWFAENRFGSIRRLSHPVSVQGIKS